MIRWTAKRKVAVLEAIEAKVLSKEKAMALYSLSEEELEGWQRAWKAHGTKALLTTKIQIYRGYRRRS